MQWWLWADTLDISPLGRTLCFSVGCCCPVSVLAKVLAGPGFLHKGNLKLLFWVSRPQLKAGGEGRLSTSETFLSCSSGIPELDMGLGWGFSTSKPL